MTDQSFEKAKTLEDVMDMPMEEHASIMRRYLVELSEKGIGGMFLLTDDDRAVGGFMGANKVALARLICDLMEDEDIYVLTHEEMAMRRVKPKRGRERYDA
jgi:hypothetical protein